MTYKVMAIRDLKVNIFNMPWFALSIGQAIRNFGDLVQDPQSAQNKHPEDYNLYQLGEFDDETGAFQNLVAPTHVASGKDFASTEGLHPVRPSTGRTN